MKLDELYSKLDNFFKIHAYDESDGWLFAMTDSYREAFKQYARITFVEGTWNGLMLDNRSKGEQIDRVYLVVFPTPNIIDTIIAQEVERDAPGALIFAHHVTGFTEKGMEFQPIPVEQLEEMREHHISYYNCHAPLDCHPEVSTATALANALDLQDQQRFAPYYGGFAGVHGTLPPMPFQRFAEKLMKICELPNLRYDQCRFNGRLVEHIAIIAGGGNDLESLEQASDTGADTYITGHWWLFGASEYAKHEREQMRPEIGKFSMNMLGTAHYNSELVVMRDQMTPWFEDLGIEVIVMRQQDPWR